jgi:hypothetical protein
MKKITMTLSLIATLLSTSAFAKVTYDEAYAAEQARTQRNRDTAMTQADLVGGLKAGDFESSSGSWKEKQNANWITIARQSYHTGNNRTLWGSSQKNGAFLSLNLEANITASTGDTTRESIFSGIVPINSNANNLIYRNSNLEGSRCSFDVKVYVMDDSRVKVESRKKSCGGTGKGSAFNVYASNVYYYVGS